ncbi:hypothetical protein J3459_008508 [Metarhizium acridum]|uniref:uncharacterized protein n=1 Tax=Metarhizium acridum TaxID=92637 RepID=UPI001C6BD513|nr:hypothetical protein J3458_000053 [Metarhizium acridum]KAG8426044.1 hypothetical protein J3459_008508 [Metarhizium acridum]
MAVRLEQREAFHNMMLKFRLGGVVQGNKCFYFDQWKECLMDNAMLGSWGLAFHCNRRQAEQQCSRGRGRGFIETGISLTSKSQFAPSPCCRALSNRRVVG